MITIRSPWGCSIPIDSDQELHVNFLSQSWNMAMGAA